MTDEKTLDRMNIDGEPVLSQDQLVLEMMKVRREYYLEYEGREAPEAANEVHDAAAAAITVKGATEWAKYRHRDFMETGDEYEREQYERFKKRAVDAANGIEDEFYSSAARHYIIALCVYAGDIDEAQSWFKDVSIDMIRDNIVGEFPQLSVGGDMPIPATPSRQPWPRWVVNVLSCLPFLAVLAMLIWLWVKQNS